MQAERYLAAADLGTSKIALSVAKIEGDDIQIIYYKETPSDGIRYSCVFNPVRAAVPLKKAIEEAQKELNIKILQVAVGLPRYEIRQEAASAALDRTDPHSCITKEEVDHLKSQAMDSYPIAEDAREEIYGAVAQSFSADEDLVCASENDVVGTTADKLQGNFKVFIGAQKAVDNIDIMLNNVGVAPAYKFFVPNCIAHAILSENEKENGVALLEIGAGVSSVTIYRGKILRHYSSIPFGGKNITDDIKYECGFTQSLAENIKLAFGAAMPDKLQSLSEKIIQINDNETGSYERLPVKYLSEIITCRAKEIISALLYQIQESGYADKLRNGVVVTGGGANLVNIANLIKDMSGYSVRVGYPRAQAFSAGGCLGTNETSAVASIGMILEARKNPILNCIEEKPVQQEDANAVSRQNTEAEESAKQAEAPQSENEQPKTLFEADPNYNAEIVRPHKDAKKKKEKSAKITWTTIFAKKIGDLAEQTFDNTVGGLFDNMNNEQ